MRRLVGILGLLLFAGAGAIGGVELWGVAGETYETMTSTTHVAPGVAPRMTAQDAAGITYGYLTRMRLALPNPALHVTPVIVGIWAATADQAASLDGCIPAGKGASIVWVTKGRGDYLNLAELPWSRPAGDQTDLSVLACSESAHAGTIVIDDATGQILGVYPDSGVVNPHPSPRATPPAW